MSNVGKIACYPQAAFETTTTQQQGSAEVRKLNHAVTQTGMVYEPYGADSGQPCYKMVGQRVVAPVTIMYCYYPNTDDKDSSPTHNHTIELNSSLENLLSSLFDPQGLEEQSVRFYPPQTLSDIIIIFNALKRFDSVNWTKELNIKYRSEILSLLYDYNDFVKTREQQKQYQDLLFAFFVSYQVFEPEFITASFYDQLMTRDEYKKETEILYTQYCDQLLSNISFEVLPEKEKNKNLTNKKKYNGKSKMLKELLYPDSKIAENKIIVFLPDENFLQDTFWSTFLKIPSSMLQKSMVNIQQNHTEWSLPALQLANTIVSNFSNYLIWEWKSNEFEWYWLTLNPDSKNVKRGFHKYINHRYITDPENSFLSRSAIPSKLHEAILDSDKFGQNTKIIDYTTMGEIFSEYIMSLSWSEIS